jgi:UDP-N-acetylmuramate--alanine ligase
MQRILSKKTMLKRIRNIHFVGIGGIGMSGIAEVLHNLGHRVTGSDLKKTSITDHLESLGIKITEGHSPENIEGAQIVIYSSAVEPSNPELVRAKETNIPIIRRAEMLGELMRMKYGIGIAGTHGKTTTAWMTGRVLTQGGLDPTIIVGGRIRSLGTNAKLGNSEFLVTEADEFDRSFLQLIPTVAVVTNIETEHLDCYKPEVKKPLVTYGLGPDAAVQASRICFRGFSSSFSLCYRGEELGDIRLQVPGVHNIKNALAAAAVGLELEIEFEKIKKALEEFSGVHRRFEMKGTIREITVVDDYAHHPTEIAASLRAARDGWSKRIVSVFQPHLFSRTRDFHRDFGRVLSASDVIVVTDIYPARETPIPGVSGELIATAARESGHQAVSYVPEKEKIAKHLLQIAQPGDLIITFGAGDIWKTAEEFLRLLRKG